MRKKTEKPAAPSPASRTVVEIASFRRRLTSMLYESLLLLGILAATFILPYLMMGLFFSYVPPGFVLWLHIFLVFGLYFVWCWSRNGQTLAMQTWRLKLVRESDGKPLPLRLCWWRYTLTWPSVMLCGIGILWALIDKDRQFLHDRIAGTCIVLLPKS